MRRARWRLSLGLLPLMLGSCTTAPMPARPAVRPEPAPEGSPAIAGGAPDRTHVPRLVRPSSQQDFDLSGSFAQGGLLHGHVPAGAIALKLNGEAISFASDGAFIIGFGRDAPPSASLIAIFADGSGKSLAIPVAGRQWSIQSLPSLPQGTAPTPEFLARRKIELEQIDAARAIASDSDGWRQPFLWPATGRISGLFGSQRIYAGEPGEPHSGVDIARPAGTPVVAPADGVVVLAAAAPFTLEGNLLMIDHGMGLNSAFLHLSRIDVRVGERVRRGQLIGAVGATGRATGAHLHWGMKWRDVRIDPQLLAGPMPG